MNNMKNKILSLLVLLLTAATGAWADEVVIGEGTETTYYFPIVNFFNFSCTEEIYTADEIGTEGTINAISFYYNYGEAYTCSNVKMFMKHVTRSVFESNTDCEPLSETDLVWEGSIAPTEAGWYTFTLDTPFEYNGTDNLLVAFYDYTNGYPGTSYTWRQTPSPNEAIMALRYHSDSYTPDPYNLSNYSGSKTLLTYRGNIKLDIEGSGLDVTTNAEEGETFFTEASFQMPTFDATAEYVIVRNMGSEDVTVLVGDGTVEQPRFRVRKKEQGEGYESVEYTSLEQIAALISVYDAVEEKALTPQQDFYVKIYKIDEQTGQPLNADGVELADFDFAPGLYAVKAIAQDDSEDYGGETGFSNLFQLVEKVDLTFDPAPVVNMTVTTKEGEAEPVEATAEQLEAGKIEQLDPGTEVKLKAKKGYKLIKVVAKEEK